MANQPLSTSEGSSENGAASSGEKKTRRARSSSARRSATRTRERIETNGDHRCVSSGVAFVILLVGLGLAALNLSFMTGKAGALDGARYSLDSLLANYAARKTPPPPPAPIPEPPKPAVLFSVTGDATFRPMLGSRLADPVIDYHAAIGQPLDGLLIERKLASSRFVRVRMFFRDATEREFLWQFSADGSTWWVPDCGEGKAQACPAEFLVKYPEIAAAMRK